jgi:hypothetical protein
VDSSGNWRVKSAETAVHVPTAAAMAEVHGDRE